MDKCIVFLFLLVSKFAFSQIEISWQDLEDVEFSEMYVEEEDAYVLYPHFGSNIRELENKEISLTGYILAIDVTEGYYVLSKGPFSSCFFCGRGGPETIVELSFNSNNNSYLMDEFVTVRGVLRLNSDDIYRCGYILEYAKVYR